MDSTKQRRHRVGSMRKDEPVLPVAAGTPASLFFVAARCWKVVDDGDVCAGNS